MAAGIQLSVPGKTFLVGEYLALRGGPSVLLCTEPRFVLNLRQKKSKTPSPELFNSLSPAGKFLKDHANFFAHWEMEFHDPYGGIGGFGASTAQFALLYMFELIMREGEINSSEMQWSELLRDYTLYAHSGSGEPPSGADLIAQLTGGIVLYDGKTLDVQSADWPFKDIGFLLFHTGIKLATHEHLKSKLEIPVENLRTLSLQVSRSLLKSEAPELSLAVQSYGDQLKASGFQSPLSRAKLEWLRANVKDSQGGSAILASKACGAMGADVLAVIYKKQNGLIKAEDWRQALISAGNPENLNLIASDETLSAGLRVEEIQ